MLKKAALLIAFATLFANVLPTQAAGPVVLGRGKLNALAISPDGARLAAGTTLGVYFFDSQTFAETGFWATPLLG